MHALASNPRTPAAGRGCESCHGPGKAHADAGGDTTKILRLSQMKPQDASVYCTTLSRPGHARVVVGQPARSAQRRVHLLPQRAQPRRARRCSRPRTSRRSVRTCHKNITNKQNRFNHMPVREGKLDMRLLPQRARVDQRETAEGRDDGRRVAAPAATPRSAARISGSTRRSRTPASPATTRTGATTIACCRRSSRFSASAAT